jgi:hypothetical protein
MNGVAFWYFAPLVGANMSDVLQFFIQHPLRILMLAALPATVWASLRWGLRFGRRADPLLWPVAGVVAFAAWEWLVMVRTPEANLRVDLLLIWPLLALLTLWSLFRALRR